jgi:hypothetical protein
MRRSGCAVWGSLRYGFAAAILVGGAGCGGSSGGGGIPPIVLDASSDAPRLIILSDSGTGGDAGHTEGSAGNKDAGADALTKSPELIAVPLVGCTPSEYNATWTVGGTQKFSLSVDTGSGTLGIASPQCPDCDVTPEYNPGSSAIDEGMMVDSQYGSGSWSGEVYQDSVGPTATASAAVKLVAIDAQSTFFEPVNCGAGGPPQGIIGFGPGTSAVQGTDAFFDQFVNATGIPNVFATELCDSSGMLWLGGYDPTFTTAPPQYVPMASDFLAQVYYAVNLTSITVNGVATPVASPQYEDSVVDTGTSVFILGSDAFNGISAALAADTAVQQLFGGASGATSYLSSPYNCMALTQTKAELDSMLPAFTMTFGNVAVKAAPTESWLIEYDGQWCPGLAGTAQGDDSFPFASIMGSPVLRSNIVIFDRQNSQVGFAPHKACP